MKNYGLLGEHLGHSLSPIIHKEVFAEKNISASYTLLEVPPESLPHILPALHTLGFSGVNITIPYKKSLLPYFDTVSPEARAIGAVNTVKLEGGASSACNTDYHGFGLMLERAGIAVKGQKMTILGTGGASLAAAAYGIAHGASQVVFISRSPQGELLGCPVLAASSLEKGGILVNATPLGMHPKTEDSPLEAGQIALFETAADLIYRPQETLFLKTAQALGLQTAGGLDMLIGQALEAQKFWNGWSFRKEFFDFLHQKLEAAL